MVAVRLGVRKAVERCAAMLPGQHRRRPTVLGYRWAHLGVIFGLAWTIPGCGGMAPNTRIQESRDLARSLQTENSQLKDAELRLRARNAELAQRVNRDANVIRDQEERLRALDVVVATYRQERDRMADAFDRFRNVIQEDAERTKSAVQTTVWTNNAPVPAPVQPPMTARP